MARLVLLRLVITTFDINGGALASPGLQSVLAAVAFAPTACSQLLEFLTALLVKVLEVNLHDFLDQIVHLGLVLNHLCDVDDLFAL